MNVGTIEARVRARTDTLRNDANESRSIFRRIGGDADSLTGKFKKMASTLGLGIGIAGLTKLGLHLVKASSDANETGAKFDQVFRSIREDADKTAKELARGFAMSNSEAKMLLGNTSDLLIGFGMQREEALRLSETTQKLAADLASYNNLQGGTTRASEILTKAMLGERDALISLGVKISDADVKTRLAEKGQKNLEGQARLTAIALVTMELALEQTKDAQGDLSRNTDTYATQVKKLQANIKNLAEDMGKYLLPIATEITEKLNRLFDKMEEAKITKLENKLKKLADRKQDLETNRAMKGASLQFFDAEKSGENELKRINEELKQTLLLLDEIRGGDPIIKNMLSDMGYKFPEKKQEQKTNKNIEDLQKLYKEIDSKGVLPKSINEIGREIGEKFKQSLSNFSIPVATEGEARSGRHNRLLGSTTIGKTGSTRIGDTVVTSGPAVGDWDTKYRDTAEENRKYAEGREAGKRRKANEKEPEVKSTLNQVSEGLASTIPVLGAFTKGLASGIIAVITSSTTWKDSMEKMSKPIMEIVEVIGYALKPVLDIVVDAFRGLAKIITWIYNEVFVGLANGIISIINGIIKMVNWAIPGKKWDIAQVDYMKRTYDMADASANASDSINNMNNAVNNATATFNNLSNAVKIDVIRARVIGNLSNKSNSNVDVNIKLDTGKGALNLPTVSIDPATGTQTKLDINEYLIRQRQMQRGY